jgi:tetratricopeptide (TPR) repeat protein
MAEEEKLQEIERIFKDATELRDSGRLVEAAEKLHSILSMSPQRKAPILGPLAHIYFLLKDYENARSYFVETLRLSPKSELASLGLFHTLWNMGKPRDAFEEAKRFLALRDSEEYFLLAEEMRDAFEAGGIDLNQARES